MDSISDNSTTAFADLPPAAQTKVLPIQFAGLIMGSPEFQRR
jgi:hypothetical protein